MNRLLKTEEVLKRLQVSRSTLYALRRQGTVHPVRLGTVVRYSEREIEGLMQVSEGGDHGG